jgi:hypothetical protein
MTSVRLSKYIIQSLIKMFVLSDSSSPPIKPKIIGFRVIFANNQAIEAQGMGLNEIKRSI